MDTCLTSFSLGSIEDTRGGRKNSGLRASKSHSRPAQPLTSFVVRQSLPLSGPQFPCKRRGWTECSPSKARFGDGSYLRGPQPLYQRDQVKRGILGFQAFHPDFQTLPLCQRSSGQRVRFRSHQGAWGRDTLEDVVTYLCSKTWMEPAGLFSFSVRVIRTHYKEKGSVLSVQQWNQLPRDMMTVPHHSKDSNPVWTARG